MKQATLFDGHHRGTRTVSIQTPAARVSDPETSHEAAEGVTKSGMRSEQQLAVLRLVEWWPGRTAGELARELRRSRPMWTMGNFNALPIDERECYIAIQRRVSELEPQFVRRGESRTCSVRGTKQTTIWPVESP